MKRRSIVVTTALILALLLTVPVQAFRDVPSSAWYAESVNYVLEKQYMEGVSEKDFAPNESVTRGMLVTVLYRVAGLPKTKGNSGFSDVKKGAYYADAVTWASVKGIVNGYSEKSFGPDDAVTREQAAAILYRYADTNGYDVSAVTDVTRYADAAYISAYAMDAMRWANAVGLLTGTSDSTLSPRGTATRAQLAAVIMRYDKLVGAGSTKREEKMHGQEDLNSPKPEITVKSVAAHAGDSDVQVVVSVKNNPGILGMTLILSYDDSVMELKKAENGAALKRVLTMTGSKTLSDGCRFIWDGVEITPSDVADGDILVLTFSVNGSAARGSYPVSFQSGGIVDNRLAPVDVSIVNGSITVA